jgi:hypothetical protein
MLGVLPPKDSQVDLPVSSAALKVVPQSRRVMA